MPRKPSDDSKYGKVKNYLRTNKSINSLQAFELFAVTRLSAIIFRLRYDEQWTIISVDTRYVDKKGNEAIYSRYSLKSTTPPAKKQKPQTKFHKKIIVL
jgi:Helix-turn-helix domain